MLLSFKEFEKALTHLCARPPRYESHCFIKSGKEQRKPDWFYLGKSVMGLSHGSFQQRPQKVYGHWESVLLCCSFSQLKVQSAQCAISYAIILQSLLCFAQALAIDTVGFFYTALFIDVNQPNLKPVLSQYGKEQKVSVSYLISFIKIVEKYVRLSSPVLHFF